MQSYPFTLRAKTGICLPGRQSSILLYRLFCTYLHSQELIGVVGNWVGKRMLLACSLDMQIVHSHRFKRTLSHSQRLPLTFQCYGNKCAIRAQIGLSCTTFHSSYHWFKSNKIIFFTTYRANFMHSLVYIYSQIFSVANCQKHQLME